MHVVGCALRARVCDKRKEQLCRVCDTKVSISESRNRYMAQGSSGCMAGSENAWQGVKEESTNVYKDPELT